MLFIRDWTPDFLPVVRFKPKSRGETDCEGYIARIILTDEKIKPRARQILEKVVRNLLKKKQYADSTIYPSFIEATLKIKGGVIPNPLLEYVVAREIAEKLGRPYRATITTLEGVMIDEYPGEATFPSNSRALIQVPIEKLPEVGEKALKIAEEISEKMGFKVIVFAKIVFLGFRGAKCPKTP